MPAAEHPGVGIVVVALEGDHFALGLMRQGASGMAFLLDDRISDLDNLVTAITQAQGGQVTLDSSVVDALVRRRGGSRLDELTLRELDVLAEMAKGLPEPCHRREAVGLRQGGGEPRHRHLSQARRSRRAARRSPRGGGHRVPGDVRMLTVALRAFIRESNPARRDHRPYRGPHREHSVGPVAAVRDEEDSDIADQLAMMQLRPRRCRGSRQGPPASADCAVDRA